MQKSFVFSAVGLALAATGAQAQVQETARVLSSTPIIQQVAVPRQVCNNQPVAVQQPRTTGGAGSVIGAIAGGLLGNTIGGGSGRAAATVLGVVGGAVVGDNVQNNGGYNTSYQNVQQCSTQTYYENRTVGYNVTYEYGGREYTAQMAQDPGTSIRLQLTPIGAAPASQPPDYAYSQPQQQYQQPQQYQQQQPVIVNSTQVQPVMGIPGTVIYDSTYPVYPAYAPAPVYYGPAYPYYPPVGVSLNLGYSRGFYGHGHRGYRR